MGIQVRDLYLLCQGFWAGVFVMGFIVIYVDIRKKLG